jgi:hypothetical protein
MKSNRFQLISDKTEVLWCAATRCQHQLPTAASSINGVPVAPVSYVRDFGIYVDADLVMQAQIEGKVSWCLLRSGNCVRFANQFRLQHSRPWWLHWLFLDWTTVMASRLPFRFRRCVVGIERIDG